jgi:hypothetical protein
MSFHDIAPAPILEAEVRAMRQTKTQQLTPELRSKLVEALEERFPPGWEKGKSLDEMVAETSSAALEVASALVQRKVKEPPDAGPAPVCPNPDCERGKKGAARGSSKFARRRS